MKADCDRAEAAWAEHDCVTAIKYLQNNIDRAVKIPELAFRVMLGLLRLSALLTINKQPIENSNNRSISEMLSKVFLHLSSMTLPWS